jgi:hypothetical protein
MLLETDERLSVSTTLRDILLLLCTTQAFLFLANLLLPYALSRSCFSNHLLLPFLPQDQPVEHPGMDPLLAESKVESKNCPKE